MKKPRSRSQSQIGAGNSSSSSKSGSSGHRGDSRSSVVTREGEDVFESLLPAPFSGTSQQPQCGPRTKNRSPTVPTASTANSLGMDASFMSQSSETIHPADFQRISASGFDGNLWLSGNNKVSGVSGTNKGPGAHKVSGSDTEPLDICMPCESPKPGVDLDALSDLLSQLRDAQGDSRDFVKLRNRFKSVETLRKRFTTAPGVVDSRRYMFYSELTNIVKGDGFDSIDDLIQRKLASTQTQSPTPASSSSSSPPSPPPYLDNNRGLARAMKDGYFWMDITDPSEAEMKLFTKIFHVHSLTAEDLQTPDTREKCEIFLHYYYLNIRTFDQNQYSMSYLQPVNLGIVVFRDFILTFHSHPLPHPNSVIARMSQLKLYGLKITPDWITYALVDDIVDSFGPILRNIELEVDSIDDLVLILKENESSDMLRRIGHARKKVMLLLRLLSTKADVLRTLIKRCSERSVGEKSWVSSEVSLYLGDIMDHAITMVQNLAHYEKTLSRSHSNYLAQILIELTQASNQTNDSVMKMTALASILVPLNVITGLFGMNVPVPGQSSPNNEHFGWFFGIIGFMVIVSCLTYMWLKRHRLVGSSAYFPHYQDDNDSLEAVYSNNNNSSTNRNNSINFASNRNSGDLKV